MRNVVFLVKNGIGYGHIRRALLLAEALTEHAELRPIVISQAATVDLYRTAPAVRVVNFPLLHRVSSAVTEDGYIDLLDRLLAALDPALIIEDTYPDARYGAPPSLRGIPRLLVMRRLDGLSFDSLRESGAFRRYREILIAQTPDEFDLEGHSGASVAAAHSSDRVRFVGNLHQTPTSTEIAAARAQYAPDGQRLVVVNAGAGGDQMPDGYGDRLFTNTAHVARRLHAEDVPTRFVLITGPYYAGRPLHNTANVTVRRFDPNLPALLAAADVAVIKPGNNALSEALHGNANLVLVPDVSFMEGLDDHAARITATYGGTVTTPDTPALDTAIREALATPPRTHRPPPSNALHDVLDRIEHWATNTIPQVRPRRLALLIEDKSGIRFASPAQAPTTPSPAIPHGAPHRWTVIDDAPAESPTDLADKGIRLLISRGEPSPTIRRWHTLAPSNPSLHLVAAHPLTPHHSRTRHQLADLLNDQPTAIALLDLRGNDPDTAHHMEATLLSWLAEQPVDLIDPDIIEAELGNDLMGLAP